MTKTMLIPVLATLNLLLKSIFHIEIPEDVMNGAADFILTGASLVAVIYGIVKNHKKGE